MKKRLVILLGGFAIGGAEHMVYELVKHINRERYNVTVLCYMPKQNTALESQVEKICQVLYLNETGTIKPSAILKALRALRKLRPDVVHAHLGGSGFGAIWAFLTGKHFVVTAHTKPEKAFSSKIEKFVRLALKRENTTLVGVSEENKILLKQYFNVDDHKLCCVNNGVDLGRFRREAHEGFTLINVARQDENKNQAVLLRCFAQLYKQDNTVKLLLLGDGPMHEKLKKQAEEWGLSEAVTFTGNVSNTEDYYAVSDLYVQTSHREAMPLSVLEAMAAGLPIISTDVGGLKDVVQDNGILVPDNNEEALYQAIMKIYSQSPEEAKRMEKASHRIVQAYSSEAMACAYEIIYDGNERNAKKSYR